MFIWELHETHYNGNLIPFPMLYCRSISLKNQQNDFTVYTCMPIANKIYKPTMVLIKLHNCLCTLEDERVLSIMPSWIQLRGRDIIHMAVKGLKHNTCTYKADIIIISLMTVPSCGRKSPKWKINSAFSNLLFFPWKNLCNLIYIQIQNKIKQNLHFFSYDPHPKEKISELFLSSK